jgi:hypothetical protein
VPDLTVRATPDGVEVELVIDVPALTLTAPEGEGWRLSLHVTAGDLETEVPVPGAAVSAGKVRGVSSRGVTVAWVDESEPSLVIRAGHLPWWQLHHAVKRRLARGRG